MNPTIESALSQTLPSFDQIVKGNVSIKKLSKYRYRITFSKIGKFLMYQVWDKDDVNKMNAKRQVGYVSAKEWVKHFNERNERNNFLDFKFLFTPTTIMETENSNYAFVIHKVYLNSCDKVVFTVSTEEISLKNNISKKLVRLPLGKCNHVRFDIDPIVSPITVINRIREITNNRVYSDPTLTDDVRINVLKYFATLPFNRTYSLYCPTLMGVDDCGTKENYLTEGTPVYKRFVAIMNAAGFTNCLSGETFDPRCSKGCFNPAIDPILDPGSCA